MSTVSVAEPGELTEQQRGTVQLSQADRFTMQGHLREKLRLGRKRLAKTWGLASKEETPPETDDVQILARDIVINEPQKETPAAVAPSPPAPPPAEKTSKWPMAAALALGLGVPGTAAVLMAPSIIDSFLQKPDPVVQAPAGPDYVPILVPGKPAGAK